MCIWLPFLGAADESTVKAVSVKSACLQEHLSSGLDPHHNLLTFLAGRAEQALEFVYRSVDCSTLQAIFFFKKKHARPMVCSQSSVIYIVTTKMTRCQQVKQFCSPLVSCV